MECEWSYNRSKYEDEVKLDNNKKIEKDSGKKNKIVIIKI